MYVRFDQQNPLCLLTNPIQTDTTDLRYQVRAEYSVLIPYGQMTAVSNSSKNNKIKICHDIGKYDVKSLHVYLYIEGIVEVGGGGGRLPLFSLLLPPFSLLPPSRSWTYANSYATTL